MLGGPKLTERQVLDRISEVVQVHEASGGVARYRTAVLFEQKEPFLLLDGLTPPILVWRIACDSRKGNTYDVVGFHDRSGAVSECVEWVGHRRQISLDLIAGSALTIVMSNIQRIAWR